MGRSEALWRDNTSGTSGPLNAPGFTTITQEQRKNEPTTQASNQQGEERQELQEELEAHQGGQHQRPPTRRVALLSAMPCYHPIVGYQSFGGGPLSFHEKKDQNQITIPCGQCIGCRLKISREWATRCMHEKQMHKHNCTITLTYDDEHLPGNMSLDYKDFQAFMKRLRKNMLGKGKEATARFYMGAEYGERTNRPHYHACLFGIDFNDKIYNRTTPAGFKIYTSETLNRLWKKGFTSIGDLTFESAAYIARYIMKKRNGKHEKSYEITDIETGEITIRKKEFNQMSRKPGIGKAWLEKYEKDIYPHAKVIIRGHRANTPRYYDKIWAEKNQLAHEDLAYARQLEAKAQAEHHTPERLAVQEQVQKAKIKTLKRHL